MGKADEKKKERNKAKSFLLGKPMNSPGAKELRYRAS
jgi:hypothetical protein